MRKNLMFKIKLIVVLMCLVVSIFILVAISAKRNANYLASSGCIRPAVDVCSEYPNYKVSVGVPAEVKATSGFQEFMKSEYYSDESEFASFDNSVWIRSVCYYKNYQIKCWYYKLDGYIRISVYDDGDEWLETFM